MQHFAVATVLVTFSAPVAWYWTRSDPPSASSKSSKSSGSSLIASDFSFFPETSCNNSGKIDIATSTDPSDDSGSWIQLLWAISGLLAAASLFIVALGFFGMVVLEIGQFIRDTMNLEGRTPLTKHIVDFVKREAVSYFKKRVVKMAMAVFDKNNILDVLMSMVRFFQPAS